MLGPLLEVRIDDSAGVPSGSHPTCAHHGVPWQCDVLQEALDVRVGVVPETLALRQELTVH